MEIKEKKGYSINIPPDLMQDLTELQQRKHIGDLASTIRLGLSEWIQMEKDPTVLNERIRAAIRNDPSLVKDQVSEEVQKQVQIELRRIFGEKYTP